MIFRSFTALGADCEGRSLLKMTFGLCVLAMAGAASSPAFEANPLIGGTITKFRSHLPETLQKATDAMSGQ